MTGDVEIEHEFPPTVALVFTVSIFSSTVSNKSRYRDMAYVSLNSSGKLDNYLSLEARKNTVLGSHGRPPW